MGMQGMGKPGVNFLGGYASARPSYTRSTSVGGAMRPGRAVRQVRNVRSKQFLPKTLVAHAILDASFENPISWYGHTANAELMADQLEKFYYPIPQEDGGAEIHLYWCDKPCNIGCWNGGYKFIEAYRSPKLECIIFAHQWMAHDCIFGDIILPISTAAELDDLCQATGDNQVVFYKPKAIQPIGESKSDYEAVLAVGEKLLEYGNKYSDVMDNLTEGMNFDELIRYGYEGTEMAQTISWEEFQQLPYVMSGVNPEWPNRPWGNIRFYENPEENPRDLPSGKLEFYSQTLADNFPDDDERGPYPRYVIGGPNPNWSVSGPGWTHDESLDVEYGAERCKEYPFLLVSNHPHWRVHVQCDDIPWFREIETCKVKGPDGYMYEPLWINPIDADKLGIRNGDIVKMWNERGIELGGAYVTHRIIPGAVYQDHGAREDFISSWPDHCINRGGTNNQISPEPGVSRNCWGMATGGYLVNVEKLDPAEMEGWRTSYPEVFARAENWDPAWGERFSDWLAEGGD
jgi:trimethylamine-N-oxide reductase (cytochrome c)